MTLRDRVGFWKGVVDHCCRACRLQGVTRIDVKKIMAKMMDISSAPHHQVIHTVFNSEYPDEVFATFQERCVFESFCELVDIDFTVGPAPPLTP